MVLFFAIDFLLSAPALLMLLERNVKKNLAKKKKETGVFEVTKRSEV